MAENRKVDNNKKGLNNRSLKLSWFSLKLAAPPCKKKTEMGKKIMSMDGKSISWSAL